MWRPRMPSPLDRLRRAESGPPDFVGVGALASGIGWWHELLLAHPEIRPPQGDDRELHFFDRFCAAELTGADIVAYHALFQRPHGTICGEWTRRYMFDPWTPPLLRRAAPDARLLVMVSDPIERYRSVFTDRLAKRAEGETLYMADVVDRRSFGAQLARLYRFYDPRRVLVLQFERCRRDPLGQYRRTLEFLGARDTGFAPGPLRRKAAGRPESLPVAVLRRVGLPAGTRRRVMARLGRRPVTERVPAPLWPDIEDSLHTALDPDVQALAELVPELDLTLWPNFAHLAAKSSAFVA
jgi:hypothetical protein